MVMKKQIELKLFGLNETGVNELNEFYKDNIRENYIEPFQIGEYKDIKRKRIKQINSFTNTGLDTHITLVGISQYIPGSEYHGPDFSLQLKHFKHEVYEVEIVETFKKVNQVFKTKYSIFTLNKKTKVMNYSKRELQQLDTIEQAWDGDELKIDDGDVKVWLVHRENRQYNGDYVVETCVNGKWIQENYYFD